MKNLILITLCCFLNFYSLNAQNRLVLKTGEEMNGKVISILNNELIFSFKGNDLKIPINVIANVVFSDSIPVSKKNNT